MEFNIETKRTVNADVSVNKKMNFTFSVGGGSSPQPAPPPPSPAGAPTSNFVTHLSGTPTMKAKQISYKLLQYLKSTGSQYVVTDIVPTYENTRVELDMKLGSTVYGNDRPLGLFGYGSPTHGYFMVITNDANQSGTDGAVGVGFFCGYNTSLDQSPWGYWMSDVAVYNRATVILQRSGLSQWGSKTTNLSPYPISFPEPSGGMPLFGYVRGDAYTPYGRRDMWLYKCKVYQSGVLTNELFPAERQIDKALGLYDTVTGKFYPGTGEFEKGE